MRLGYNTNGTAFHAMGDAIRLLAGIGYRSIAITLDQHHLNPFEKDLDQSIETVRGDLKQFGMCSVIETGARFLLDPSQKHAPTIFDSSPERRSKRIDFWCRAIDIASQLDSDCVSIWSGIAPEGDSEQHWQFLIDALRVVICLLYTSPSPRDQRGSRMPSSA